jgi:REP element-mobilizing transposase RayT
MVRLARAEVFAPDEISVVHVMARVVRRCFLLGDDPLTRKNYDHRKLWIEDGLQRLSAAMGIDLICFAILSNHFHLVLRSRPDVVATWDDHEVARRWLMLCPVRKNADGRPLEPNEAELNAIRNDPQRVSCIRSRLSDISWWMRLLCQRIAMRANREDEEQGKFFQSRFKAVRLLDETALLACAAYVDLNPIRAALAETIESSDHTSAQRRCQTLAVCQKGAKPPTPLDRMLSPVQIDELRDALGARPSASPDRCSDQGFLAMSSVEYLQLLDWTARHIVDGKRGSTPEWIPPLISRLGLDADVWCALVGQFGKLFHNVAGRPRTVDSRRSLGRRRRFHMRRQARELLSG